MLAPFLTAFVLPLLPAGAGATLTEVPRSRSPSGSFALFYETFPNRAGRHPDFAAYFCGAGEAPASAQIIPDPPDDSKGVPWDDATSDRSDTEALLDLICNCNEFHRRGQLYDSGFCYNVTWTADQRWVVVEGGAHKFWHMAAWHLKRGRFHQIDFASLSPQIERCFRAQMAAPKFQELGIDKEMATKWGVNHGTHYVKWLGDGRFAVLGYPFLLLNGDFNHLQERGEIYFIVDCRDSHVLRVVGMAH